MLTIYVPIEREPHALPWYISPRIIEMYPYLLDVGTIGLAREPARLSEQSEESSFL